MISRIPARSLYSSRVVRSHVARPNRSGTTARAEPESASEKSKKPEEVAADIVEPVVEAAAETVDEATPEPATAPTPSLDTEDVSCWPCCVDVSGADLALEPYAFVVYT